MKEILEEIRTLQRRLEDKDVITIRKDDFEIRLDSADNGYVSKEDDSIDASDQLVDKD